MESKRKKSLSIDLTQSNSFGLHKTISNFFANEIANAVDKATIDGHPEIYPFEY